MNVRLRRFGLIGIVAVAACTPFGPITPDGGDGGSSTAADSSSDATPDAAPDVPQDLATDQPDVNAGFDLVADTEVKPDAAGQPNGRPCGGPLECTSGHCAEGTCCDAACANGCFSCLASNTGQPDGKCAAVEAGHAHASDCAASDPTTCGLDGKCDGAGACRHWPSTTSCGAESCADGAGASTYTSARTCDGAGTCAAATTSTCGNAYRCSSTKCKTTCSGASDCIAAAYCTSNACVRKKTDGAVCAADAECLNGVCGGRCCAAGCSCTQPNPNNVLKNPGFDTDTSDWTVDVGFITRQPADSEGCPYSGSLLVSPPSGNPGASITLTQCASNVTLNGSYNFGISMMGASGICGVRFYTSADCSGDEIVDDELMGVNGTGWQSPPPEAPYLTVTGAHSVLFFCLYASGYFDEAYVSPTPAKY